MATAGAPAHVYQHPQRRSPSLLPLRYIAGERNAPPEDCGGIPGFYQTLDAAADPKHPNHAEAKKWLDDYDPNLVDELPIKYALGRIANQRNAAKARLAKKKPPGLPADQPMLRPRPSPDGYEKSRLSSLLGDREASLI